MHGNLNRGESKRT